ncbi:MAG: TraG family conjugative transposon ATPase [Flavobacteriales bacterium]|nr:TraG family conjugative transposon ATPase [Flavobacteriales bacterium]
MTASRNMEEVLPLFSYEQGYLVSKQGDLTACFELILPPLFTLSQSELDGLHTAFVKAFRLLPPHTLVWKQDWFIKSEFLPASEKGFEEEESFLSRSSSRFFQGKPILDHACYLWITFPFSGKKLSDSSLSNLFRSHWVGEPASLKTQVESHTAVLAQIEHLLTSENIAISRISEDKLLGTPLKKGLIEAYLLCPGKQTFPEIQDMEFKPEWKIGQNFLGMISISGLNQLPMELSNSKVFEPYSTDQSKFYLGFASPVGQLLDCNHIYSQVFQMEEKEKFFSELESKRLRLHALSRYSRSNDLASDSIASYLDESIREGKIPVKGHANLLIWADSSHELKQTLREASASISKLGILPKIETWGAPQLYWAGIPGNGAALPSNECFHLNLDQFICLYNLEGASASGVLPKGLRMGERRYGQPVWVDLSDEPMQKGWITNRNKFILGPSGSGKSFFTNHMVRSYFEQGTHVVLVDVGHSYQGLCELVGGYYFTYSEDSPLCFNPFFLDGEGLDTEKKESLKTLLLALWKKEDEVFRRSEYVAISNAIKAYYEYLDRSAGVFPCFDTFYEFLLSDFSGIIEQEKVSSQDFDLKNFLYVLRPFFRGGEFDYLLNAQENLNLLNQRFIVFELDKIKDHPILFPVVTLIIMEIFISKMRKLKGQRKMILIEEAWKAIAKEGMAEYIKYLFKTVRKFFGEAIVVTQEVDDIIHSPVIKDAIINNSDCKILLDQSKYQNKFEQIQKLLGLTEKEKAMILSINRANDPSRKYKEVFIGLGSHSQVFRTEVSLEEYLTYTTEEKEKLRIEELCRLHGGSREKAIAALAEELQS